jgi:hypothetical protein
MNPSLKELQGPRSLPVLYGTIEQAAEKASKADSSRAKARSECRNKGLQRWPEGQLYPIKDFFRIL